LEGYFKKERFRGRRVKNWMENWRLRRIPSRENLLNFPFGRIEEIGGYNLVAPASL